MKQKISIVTVVKNGMPFLKDCIKSFQSQNFSSKELIIIYSKSEDNTEQYLKKIKGNIRVFKDLKYKNKFGPLNFGIKKASGKYIFFMDVDDQISKNSFSI